MERAKQFAKKLWNRIQSGLSGGTNSELETAKSLLQAIKEKYGWSDSDFLEVEGKNEPENRLFSPVFDYDAKYKKLPVWFIILVNLVSKHFNCRVITEKKSLACILIGMPADTLAFEKELLYALDRSKSTFSLAKALLGKILKREDYFHGFAVGLNLALTEIEEARKKKEVEELVNDGFTKLILINNTLVEVEAETKKATNANEEEFKAEIKDEASFLLGVRDGRLAKKNLKLPIKSP